MSISARIFVAFIFIILGVSFIATTVVLYNDFKDTEWSTYAVFYSHLFIFFPTFGIIALIAFYIPACVLVDMYWKIVRFGKIRFFIGMIVLALGSYFISTQILKGDIPTLWGPAPHILKADKGEGCDSSLQTCRRVPVLQALLDVREKSQQRVGLSKFARDCNPDPLIETQKDLIEKRYCFVTKTLTDAKSCCIAQKGFTDALAKMYKSGENRSFTEEVHIILLPLKIFFLLVILIIGIMLATWRKNVDKYYSDYIFYVERGLMVGAVSMLIWPIANHAYLQSQDVLYGAYQDGIYATIAPLLSFLFGAWALALLFFFFRSLEKDIEAVGKIAGVIGSAIAILKYEEIVDYAVRIAGSGADKLTMGILGVLGFFIFVPFLFTKRRKPKKE